MEPPPAQRTFTSKDNQRQTVTKMQTEMKYARKELKNMSLKELAKVGYKRPDHFDWIFSELQCELEDCHKKAIIDNALEFIKHEEFRQLYHHYWRSWLIAVVKALEAELEPHD